MSILEFVNIFSINLNHKYVNIFYTQAFQITSSYFFYTFSPFILQALTFTTYLPS